MAKKKAKVRTIQYNPSKAESIIDAVIKALDPGLVSYNKDGKATFLVEIPVVVFKADKKAEVGDLVESFGALLASVKKQHRDISLAIKEGRGSKNYAAAFRAGQLMRSSANSVISRPGAAVPLLIQYVGKAFGSFKVEDSDKVKKSLVEAVGDLTLAKNVVRLKNCLLFDDLSFIDELVASGADVSDKDAVIAELTSEVNDVKTAAEVTKKNLEAKVNWANKDAVAARKEAQTAKAELKALKEELAAAKAEIEELKKNQ